MRTRLSITAVVLVLLSSVPPPTAYAESDAGDEFAYAIDLPSLEVYARRHNPEIAAMEQRWRAAQTRPSQEGSLPDPMVNTAYHNEGFGRFDQGRSDFAWLRFGAEQELPFPGKLSLKETVAARGADRERALYRATTLNVVSRLRIAYDDYFLAQKSIEIVRSNTELLKKLTQAAQARYEVGEGLQQDLARAEVELSILLGRLATHEQERESAVAMLNALLNRPAGAPVGPPAPVDKRPLPYALDQLHDLAREQSPRIEAAGFGVAGAEAAKDLAKRQYYPDFILRADYFNKAAMVPEWEVGVGIRAPLYFWRKQAFGVQEAAAGLSEARATRQAILQEVLARVKELYAQATSADRLVQLYGMGVVPQAEVALRSASAAYEVGKVDFLSMLNSFTVLNEYQIRYYLELTNFDKAVAQIEELAGLPPDSGVAP